MAGFGVAIEITDRYGEGCGERVPLICRFCRLNFSGDGAADLQILVAWDEGCEGVKHVWCTVKVQTNTKTY